MSRSSPSVSAAARRIRLVLLALSLVAAVLGMHGLTAGVISHQTRSMAAMAMSVMTAPLGAPDPGHPGGHDGPTASGHHSCVAAQPATSPTLAPTARLTAAAPARVASSGRARATSDVTRAPPDLHELCVSRT